METFLTTLIGSSVGAAIVTGWVRLRVSEKAVRIEHITQERMKWREHIRNIASEISKSTEKSSSFAELRMGLTTRLNPMDAHDAQILKCFDSLVEDPGNRAYLEELGNRIALLLKHDWERAKWEASTKSERSVREPCRCDYSYEAHFHNNS